MKKLDKVMVGLLIVGPIVLRPFITDDIEYMSACFLYAVALSFGKLMIDDLGVDD